MDTLLQVLTVIASMAIGAVVTGWALYMASRPPRPVVRRSPRHPAGRHRPEVVARSTAEAAAQADRAQVVRHNAGVYRYRWPTLAGPVGGRS